MPLRRLHAMAGVVLAAVLIAPSLMNAPAQAEEEPPPVPGITVADPQDGWVQLPEDGVIALPAPSSAGQEEDTRN